MSPMLLMVGAVLSAGGPQPMPLVDPGLTFTEAGGLVAPLPLPPVTVRIPLTRAKPESAIDHVIPSPGSAVLLAAGGGLTLLSLPRSRRRIEQPGAVAPAA